MHFILYLLIFVGGALCDHYFEAKVRAFIESLKPKA